MAWTYLLIAGACEIVATTLFRYTEQFTRFWPSVICFAVGMVSFYLLNRSLTGVPLGTAYAVWTGIGAVGTVLVGILVFREPASFWRLFFIVMLISSIIGLKMVSH